MTAAKKRGLEDSNQFMVAARLVPFIMSFVMLFMVPLSPLLTSCQGTNALITKGDDSQRRKMTHRPESTVITAVQEAAIGGTGGKIIARQMDALASELAASLEGIAIERIAEGILVTIDSRILFKDDCSDLQSTAKRKLRDVSQKLRAYNHTNLIVEGHTDNTAEQSYNFFLSELRAKAVEKYLVSHGIKNGRIRARGYGEKQPLVPNDSLEGNLINRRIEMALFANEEMKALALNGRLGEYIAAKK